MTPLKNASLTQESQDGQLYLHLTRTCSVTQMLPKDTGGAQRRTAPKASFPLRNEETT